MLSGSIGQLKGKSIYFEPKSPDVLPTLTELFCDEVLEESPVDPVPLPEPTKIVQWGDFKTQWAEGYIGKWRVAFSNFMAWYNHNIDAIETVERDPCTNQSVFRELIQPIQQHAADARILKLKIEDKITKTDFTNDTHLDMSLTRCIQRTLTDNPEGIWPCVDKLANYCNVILASLGTHP